MEIKNSRGDILSTFDDIDFEGMNYFLGLFGMTN